MLARPFDGLMMMDLMQQGKREDSRNGQAAAGDETRGEHQDEQVVGDEQAAGGDGADGEEKSKHRLRCCVRKANFCIQQNVLSPRKELAFCAVLLCTTHVCMNFASSAQPEEHILVPVRLAAFILVYFQV